MQNKPKAELNAALMLLDTRSMSFDMREIDNRRFMFSPQTGELILGRQYRGGQLYKSHAEEHFDSGAKAPFDSFIRGWIGTGRDYPNGVIHFAPNIGTDNFVDFILHLPSSFRGNMCCTAFGRKKWASAICAAPLKSAPVSRSSPRRGHPQDTSCRRTPCGSASTCRL